MREWLQGWLHRSDLGEDLLDFVLRHTEGNAFLLVQLMRTMAEENVFHHTGSAWEWTIPSALALPAGMTDLVGRRLSRLPPDALRVLVTAAALGRTFALPLLTEASGASADIVLDAVDARSPARCSSRRATRTTTPISSRTRCSSTRCSSR